MLCPTDPFQVESFIEQSTDNVDDKCNHGEHICEAKTVLDAINIVNALNLPRELKIAEDLKAAEMEAELNSWSRLIT